MYRIRIDVGSAYTKYCIMADDCIMSLFMEKTPIRQKEYFDKKICALKKDYPDAAIISCGYGKKNVAHLKSINELTALARGSHFATGRDGIVLDIGGQDTKVIFQEKERLKKFYINDKCAAGSGTFLANVLNMTGVKFKDIDLTENANIPIHLSSICAIFAQSEIVELIAGNRTEVEILQAVLWSIFIKAKTLLSKIEPKPILLSGGLSQINGIDSFASSALDRNCTTVENGTYLASIGCAVCWSHENGI